MIEVRNLSKYYRGKAAVDNISFKIEEGKTMILLGTSGCGKTTTMKMINRLIEPSSGQVLVGNQDIRQMKPEILRRNIGYVIQNIGLFPHYTVLQNIGLVPNLLKWPKTQVDERCRELMTLIGLDTSLLNRYPHELSGGQQQRVGLARALAARPDLILLDEPFGALDPITKQQIQSEFLTLDTLKNTTMLMVTHDVFEAVTLGDTICLMDQGKIQQIGQPHELVFRPVNAFVRAFFNSQRFRLELQVVKLRSLLQLIGKEEGTNSETHTVTELNPETSLLECLEQMERDNTGWLIISDFDHKKRLSRPLSRQEVLHYFYKLKENYQA